MRLALILSNDWELFGNGTGNFHELQEKPLQILLETVQRFGAKLTLFAELGQQIWGAQGPGAHCPAQRKMAAAWERSLCHAVAHGSDVQAHLHAQWLDASLNRGQWVLGRHGWAFGELPEEKIREVLSRSKQYLEVLLKPVVPTYECLCFRAGAFYMEPSEKTLRALRAEGYQADSSVVPGLKDVPRFDYRDVPSDLIPWWVGDRLTTTNERAKGLLELPLYARRGWDSPLLRKFISPQWFFRMFWGIDIAPEDGAWLVRRNRELIRRYPLSERIFLKNDRIFRAVFQRLLSRTVIPLDYDQLPPALFVRFLAAAFTEHVDRQHEKTIPIMAVGHSKGMLDGRNLERILDLATREFGDRLCFWTVRDAIDHWSAALARRA